MDEKLLTLQEAAEFLSCYPRQVERLIKAGKIKAKNIGLGDERKHWRIAKSELLKFKEK